MAWRDCLLTIEGGTPLFLCWGDEFCEERSVGKVRWLSAWGLSQRMVFIHVFA